MTLCLFGGAIPTAFAQEEITSDKEPAQDDWKIQSHVDWNAQYPVPSYLYRVLRFPSPALNWNFRYTQATMGLQYLQHESWCHTVHPDVFAWNDPVHPALLDQHKTPAVNHHRRGKIRSRLPSPAPQALVVDTPSGLVQRNLHATELSHLAVESILHIFRFTTGGNGGV